MKKLAIVLLAACTLTLIGLIAHPLFATPSSTNRKKEHFRQLGTAVANYLSDHQKTFPSPQGNALAWLGSYGITQEHLRDELSPPQFNKNLYGKRVGDLKDPSNTVAFFALQSKEGTHWIVAFVDGSSRQVSLAEMDTVIWNP